MIFSRYLISASLFIFSSFSFSQTYIAKFENESLDDWDEKSFVDQTQYQIIQEGSTHVLKATAKQSASGIGKEKTIDLFKTPYINWSWKIENYLKGINEQSKSGDDYVARIYMVKSGGFFIWRTLALNYVWSSNQESGSIWDNAYAGKNARMLALRSSSDPLNTWVQEKRNVYEDMIHLFGDKGSKAANEEAYRYIDVVAIMTDTDDSKGEANAYYGDIFFTAE